MKNNIEITRAESMGFCFGVKEAIEEVQKYVDENNKKVYVLGMLVHNEYVINFFKKQGVIFIDEQDILNNTDPLVEEDLLIIRSHGTTKEIIDILINKKIKIVDMTCVFVKRSKKEMEDGEEEGYLNIYMGDKDHPEVKGVISYARHLIFENCEDLKNSNINKLDKYNFVFQTTYNKNEYKEIEKYIGEEFPNSKISNTICGATHKNQKAIEKLAKEVDVVFVVGGTKSSNTSKLYKISKSINENSYLISDESEITYNQVKNKQKIGISAGASTPEEVIKKVEEKLRSFDYGEF